MSTALPGLQESRPRGRFSFRSPSTNRCSIDRLQNQVIYASATPSARELEWARQSGGGVSPAPRDDSAASEGKRDARPTLELPGVAELVVRPTGLVDPKITLKPLKGQIDDLINECRQRAEAKERGYEFD